MKIFQSRILKIQIPIRMYIPVSYMPTPPFSYSTIAAKKIEKINIDDLLLLSVKYNKNAGE